MALSALAMGIIMDADHVLDYVREFGVRLNVRHLFAVSYERTFKRSWLLLHAWEWLPLAVGAVWLSDGNACVTGVVIGWFQHMLTDQFFNTPNRWAYFIIWRWRHGFDHQLAFPFHNADKKRKVSGKENVKVLNGPLET